MYKASRYFCRILMRSFKLEKYHRKVKAVYLQRCLHLFSTANTLRGMKMAPVEC